MDNDSNTQAEKKSDNTLVHQRTWTDYLWIIREHWILAILVAVCGAGFFAYNKYQAIPLYKSIAILIYEPQKDQVINIQSVVDNSLGGSAKFILQNHLTDLRSNSFRDRIVDSMTDDEKILITKDYSEGENEASIYSVIAGSNKIALIGGNIFKFEFHHRNPKAAELLANRFSEEFLDFLLERARKKNDAALRFLRSQSEELKLKVERSELAVQKYRQERNLVSLEESQNLIVERMKNLSATLNSAKVELLNLTAALEQIAEAGDDFDALATLPSINRMGTLPSKLEQRTNLLATRSTMSLRYGKRHPRMIENQSALDVIEQDIRDSLEKNVSDFKQQHVAAQARVESLDTALSQAEKDSLELDQMAIEYNVLRRKLDTDKGLFTQVHQRLNEAVLASQLSNSSLRIVDRAWPSGSPFTPDMSKINSMTAFIFLGIFISVPFGIHYLNLNLKTAADIEEQLKIPYLCEIRKFPRKIKGLHRLVLDQLHPEGVELFRQIHSQILLKTKKLEKGHTFIVTSALPKEGKSFMAINLAASFSRHHYKTLLVDCDFRRPSIGPRMRDELSKATGQEIHKGEAYVLSDTLHVVPYSDFTVEATELIESEEFKSAIEAYQAAYDIIIIDTPPSGIFPDAGLIGNLAHHIIFLTQLNKHRKATLKAILNRLDQSKAEILGIVVNRVSSAKSRNLGAYRFAKYSKYKNYYPQRSG
ncbi:MAG: GumC family protein [Puniceicoccaceae bacterium]